MRIIKKYKTGDKIGYAVQHLHTEVLKSVKIDDEMKSTESIEEVVHYFLVDEKNL